MIFATMMLGVGMALAQPTPARDQDAPALDCDDPQTQTAMNMCSKRDFEAADAELNAQWRITLARFRALDASDSDPLDRVGETRGYADTLIAAQRLWIEFRDAHCATESFVFRGGSAQPLLYNDCQANLTRARTEQLRGLLEPM